MKQRSTSSRLLFYRPPQHDKIGRPTVWPAIATILHSLKKVAFTLFFLLTTVSAFSQHNRADSVAQLLATTRHDTDIVWTIKKFCTYYQETRADTALMLAQKGYTIAKELHFTKGEAALLKRMAGAYATAGDYASSLEIYLKALDIYKNLADWENVGDCFHKLGLIFKDVEEFRQSLSFFLDEKAALGKYRNYEGHIWNAIDIAEDYVKLHQYDSAKFFMDDAYATAMHFFQGHLPGDFFNNLGFLNLKMGNNEKALTYYRLSLYEKSSSFIRNSCQSALGMAEIFQKNGIKDSALYYAKLAFRISKEYVLPLNTMRCAGFLSELYYGSHQIDSAFFYKNLENELSYNLFSNKNIRNFHTIYTSYKIKEQEVAERIAQSKQQFRLYAIIAMVLLVSALFVLIFHYKSREKNIRLEQKLFLEQKEKEQTLLELQHEKSELEMQLLRAQMNPHFIFNVLNSINHYILTHETETASDYLVKFSRLMRMVLNISEKNFVTLQQELECLDLYIRMEQLRFEDFFTYYIHCDTDIKADAILVLPLLLQPFVENAIWHGLMHKKEENRNLRIQIKQSDQMLHCTITDNGIGRKKAAAIRSKSASYKKSMGMQISASRLQMLISERSKEGFLKVIDLKDETGVSIGTKVIIQIPVKMNESITV